MVRIIRGLWCRTTNCVLDAGVLRLVHSAVF